ncbi:MAG TPA: DUF1592 domain-containing protein [Polyangiaceae bacterium]|nr:DUF1592 domain-containing protein [Polyangiaceae bacterium]
MTANRPPLLRPFACAALLALTLGCNSGGAQAPAGASGYGNAPGNEAGSGGAAPGDVPPGTNPGGVTVTCDTAASPGVSPLLRLSTLQYRNTVKDLLAAVGASAALPTIEGPLASIPDDSLADGFRGQDNRTALEHVQGYFNVGRALGDALLKTPTLLTAVAGACAGEATIGAVCVDGFLDRFVRLAYRRPLSQAERADFAALNDGLRSPAQAIRAIIIVALSSPRFLHHVEVDGNALASGKDVLQLTSYEIASRLSYTFWQTMPDAELLNAAEDGSLASDVGFAAQLERVFADPRTKQTLWGFWNEWFRFEKFTGFESTRPALQALAAGEFLGVPGHNHYADMVQEVQDLTSLFTFEKSATVAELLTTDLSVTQSADLARLYGISPWSGQGQYPKLPPTRVGLLQRAALLVSNLEQTNPFHRGAFVRRTLLCDPLPQPDPNSLPPGSLDPPMPSSAETTRQRFQAKVEGKALCQGCHGGFSDIGYALESFDALGRFRNVEQVFDEKTGDKLAELAIDTRTVPQITRDDLSQVSNAAELNQRLLESHKIEACLAERYFEFSVRRAASPSTYDECVVQDLAAGLKDPAVGLGGVFRRLAKYSSFFQRKVGPQ